MFILQGNSGEFGSSEEEALNWIGLLDVLILSSIPLAAQAGGFSPLLSGEKPCLNLKLNQLYRETSFFCAHARTISLDSAV